MNIIIVSIVVYLPYSNSNSESNNIIKLLSDTNNIDNTLYLYIKFLDFVSFYEKLIS